MTGRKKIIVIGGGAAGMMAAAQAAEAGAEVILLEKMKRPGLKIGISGKGRCNLTNIADRASFIEHFGKNGRFLHQVFNRFFSAELINFFSDLGLEVITERGGRVFPKNGRALQVVKVLRRRLEKSGVRIITQSPVTRLITGGDTLHAVECGNTRYRCDAAILTTGGSSYPATGSSGDGYQLAGLLGHRIINPRPALVPLETVEDFHAAAGLQLRNIGLRLLINGKRRDRYFGELSFMTYGISGPIALTLSLTVVDALLRGDQAALLLDLKPALDEQKLDLRLQRDLQKRCHEPLASVLRGLLPRQLVGICLRTTGLDGTMEAGVLPGKQRKKIGRWLKNFRLEISGFRGFDEAIITAGGVDLREIDPRSMQSKLVTGLYLAGELLDLQGDTGGYNLQAAFSTGWLAGRAAAGHGGE